MVRKWLVIVMQWAAVGPLWADCSTPLAQLSSLEREAVHQEILTDLQEGSIIQANIARKNGNTHDLWFVEVFNPKTQRSRQAVMKPREWGDSDGWARAPMEFVAYRLNRLLDLDYVPPTVYRRALHTSNRLIHEAPLIHLVPDALILDQTAVDTWGLGPAAITSDHRILNVLLHNSDGHHKNMLLGTHWAEKKLHPVFIDFGASFRRGTYVTMRYYPAKNNSEPVAQVRRKTLERLIRLAPEHLTEFKEHLSSHELSDLLKRRDGIVSYFGKLIQEHGESAVLLEE